MPYELRPRKPARRDALLMTIYDALPEDLLYGITLVALHLPAPYRTRSAVRRARALAPGPCP